MDKTTSATSARFGFLRGPQPLAAWLLDRLPGGMFTRSVALLAGGTVLAQAIVVAASPLVTRLYSPDDFGVVGVYASLLSILSLVACLRYELAIPLPKKDEDAAAVLVLILAIIPLVASALGLGLWCLRTQIVRWTNTPALGTYLWMLPLGVVLVGVYEAFSYWAVRKRAFARLARTRLSQGLAGVGIELSCFGLGAFGLLLAQIARSAAGITSLVFLAWRHDRGSFRAGSARLSLRLASRYRRFAQMSSLAGFANVVSTQLPVLLIAGLYSPEVVGQFVLVRRAAGWPFHLLGEAVSKVYFGEAARRLKSDPRSVIRLYFRTSFRLLLFGACPAALLLLGGPWLLPLVFGARWVAAGRYAQIMAVALVVRFLASSLSPTLYVLERNGWQLAWSIFRLALTVSALLVPTILKWSDTALIGAYAGSMIVAYGTLWAAGAWFLYSAGGPRPQLEVTETALASTGD